MSDDDEWQLISKEAWERAVHPTQEDLERLAAVPKACEFSVGPSLDSGGTCGRDATWRVAVRCPCDDAEDWELMWACERCRTGALHEAGRCETCGGALLVLWSEPRR